jgi:hypothetical protein
MLLNDIYDYRNDLPVNYTVLKLYVTKKYGAGNENAVHHWESVVDNSVGDPHVVNSNFPGATSVSNFQYEERINESKRRIKLVSKPVLDSVLKQYTAMFA